jgi:hypothetical protein
LAGAAITTQEPSTTTALASIFCFGFAIIIAIVLSILDAGSTRTRILMHHVYRRSSAIGLALVIDPL